MGMWWAGTPNFNYGNSGRLYLFPHWTAGGFDGSVSTLQNPANQASAHYVIEEDNVAQLVDEANTAWHCGNSWYNWRSISYEMVGWEGHPPTRGTLDTTAQLMADASRRYFGGARLVLGENVMLHKMVYATSCPGPSDISYLLDRANGILGGEPEGWSGPGQEIAGADRVSTAQAIAERKGITGKVMQTPGDGYADPITGMWVAGELNANILYGGDGFYLSDGTGGVYLGSDNRYGTNRYTLEFWEKVKGLDIGDTCLVVPGDSFADGVACAWVSYNLGMPIVLYEDHRNFYYLVSKFKNVIVVGNTVPKISGETERIAGADRSATAAAVAERFGQTWGQPMIVTGWGYSDGLAAAQWVGNDVLLFAEGDATVDALKRHRGEITDIYWVGDANAVPYDRRRELAEAAGLG